MVAYVKIQGSCFAHVMSRYESMMSNSVQSLSWIKHPVYGFTFYVIAPSIWHSYDTCRWRKSIWGTCIVSSFDWYRERCGIIRGKQVSCCNFSITNNQVWFLAKISFPLIWASLKTVPTSSLFLLDFKYQPSSTTMPITSQKINKIWPASPVTQLLFRALAQDKMWWKLCDSNWPPKYDFPYARGKICRTF